MRDRIASIEAAIRARQIAEPAHLVDLALVVAYHSDRNIDDTWGLSGDTTTAEALIEAICGLGGVRPLDAMV